MRFFLFKKTFSYNLFGVRVKTVWRAPHIDNCKHINMNKKTSTLAMLLFAACVSLWGSGFQVVEQGASNMGTALAGAVVNANNDATAAYWNPSAAFFVESDGKIDTGASFLVPTMEFNGKAFYPDGNPIAGSNGGNAGKLAFVPNFYLVRKLTDDFLATLSVTSPFGLETCYDEDFVGRLQGIKSNLMTLEINPSVAYKITDWLSVSVGASAHYVNADLTSTTYAGVPNENYELDTRANGHSWTGSFNVGATAKFLETGRIGVSYRYQVGHQVKGTIFVKNQLLGIDKATDITADIDLPSSLTAGVYYRFKGDWSPFALMFDYSFTQWNLFEKLTFEDANGTVVSNTPENWRNTSRFSFGIHYYPTWDEDLVFRLGGAFDQNPVTHAVDRTPRIPDSDRWWASIGLGYQIDWLNIDIAYTYILFNDVEINNDDNGHIIGNYTGHAHVLSLQAGVRW